MERPKRSNKNDACTAIGSYLKNVASYDTLSAEDELTLVKDIQKGNESAIMKLVHANLRLVLKIAYKYGYSNCSLLDLINEGNIGLMQAARKFNPEFGLRFASYAIWWIKQAISLFTIKHERGPISVPVRKALLLKKIRKERESLKMEFHREPSLKELAVRLGTDMNSIKDAITYNPEYTGWEDYLNHIGDDSSIVEQNVEEKLCSSQIKSLLKNLPDNERRGMELYYGLNGLGSSNFAEVGRELNMSREGARQLVKRSLKKLRILPQTAPMRAYL